MARRSPVLLSLALLAALSAAPAPATGSHIVHFADDAEVPALSAALWTVAGGTGVSTFPGGGCVGPVATASNWRIRDSITEPQVTPDAAGGLRYWNVGVAGAAAAPGYLDCTQTTMTSVAINLAAAVNPEFRAAIAGSSETSFDFLHVHILDLTAGTTTTVASYDASFTGGNTFPGYSTLAVSLVPFVGNTIQLQFEFVTDSSIVDGQGYNVDDILVEEH